LSHPGIVTIFDVGEEPETHAPYIVMEVVEGPTLDTLLSEGTRTLALDQALQLTLELAVALDTAHSLGVVHRDLKPANILITPDGHAKIADFGVAKLNLANLTNSGRALGTPAYMSPEQLSDGPVDGRSDLFSLGVILYTMLTGYRPFQGNSALTVSYKVVNREPIPATVLDGKLPPGLDVVIARAMAKDPAQRYQRGLEMAHDIRELQQGRSVAEVVSQVTEIAAQTAGIRGFSSAIGRGVANAIAQTKTPGPRAGAAAQTNAKKMDMSLVASVVLGGVLLAGLGVSFAVRHKASTAAIAPTMVAANAVPATPAPILTTEAKAASTTSPGEDTSTLAVPKAKPVAHMATAKRPVATLKTMSLQHPHITPAAAPEPVVVSAPEAAPPPATLEIEVNHKFSQAHLTIWVDDQLTYTHLLEGTEKKQMVVFHHVQGHEFHAMPIAAGKHVVKVEVASGPDSYDQSGTIEGEFSSGKEVLLQIHFSKKNDIQLSLQ
jgi:serine/threonine-protein kinase